MFTLQTGLNIYPFFGKTQNGWAMFSLGTGTNTCGLQDLLWLLGFKTFIPVSDVKYFGPTKLLECKIVHVHVYVCL